MAGGENAQLSMADVMNHLNNQNAQAQSQFQQSQSQLQQLNHVIQKLASDQQNQNQSNQQMANDMMIFRDQQHRQGQQPAPHPTPPPPHQPLPNPSLSLDLKLPAPTPFSGTASELRSFQLRLCEYLSGSPARYHDDYSRILYSGSVLTGAARKWYEGLMDPSTNRLPPSYTFDLFLMEMHNFFGGGVNILTLERDLADLRQTGSVSDYAIQFQNITNCFHPRWPDHPMIFQFALRMKEVVRYELMGRGFPPLTFQAFVAAAVNVEMNLAAQHSSRGGSHLPPAPRHQPTPKTQPPANQPRLQHNQPLSHDPNRMDIDGTGRARGPLPPEERKRRFDAGLCAYCGKAGHVSATCPNRYQARGTFQIPNGFHLVPHSQSQPQSQYPGVRHQIPPQTLPPPSQPPTTPPVTTQPGNSRPSQ